jgi:hypothetical protein
MRENATLFRLQQVTHLQTHFAVTALCMLNAGDLSPLPHLFLFFSFQLLLSSSTGAARFVLPPLISDHARRRSRSGGHSRGPPSSRAVHPRGRDGGKLRRRQGPRWPSPYLATRGWGRGDRIRHRPVRLWMGGASSASASPASPPTTSSSPSSFRRRLGSPVPDSGAVAAPTVVLEERSVRRARGRRRRPGRSPPLLSEPVAPPGGRGSKLTCRLGMGVKEIARVPLFLGKFPSLSFSYTGFLKVGMKGVAGDSLSAHSMYLQSKCYNKKYIF